MTLDPVEALDLCHLCAESIYDTKPPSKAYADSVANLLFGTAAQESGLVWTRQRMPRWEGVNGGFSRWQLESGSISDSLAYLKARPEMLKRATQFLFDDPHASTVWLTAMPVETLLWVMRFTDSNRLGCLFARLHYLRVPESVPVGLSDQAAYWKRWYNTVKGAGTPEQYIASWKRLCSNAVAKRLQESTKGAK